MSDTTPYFCWRNGRPRWVPGPRLRARGYRGQDLKADTGAWLPFELAVKAAEQLNAATTVDRHAEVVRLAKSNTQNMDELLKLYRTDWALDALPTRGSFIYIFGFRDWVKIGFTTNVALRLKQLSASTPEPLDVRLVANGTRVDERLLHSLFADHRTVGEWFHVSGKLANWLSLVQREEARASTCRETSPSLKS